MCSLSRNQFLLHGVWCHCWGSWKIRVILQVRQGSNTELITTSVEYFRLVLNQMLLHWSLQKSVHAETKLTSWCLAVQLSRHVLFRIANLSEFVTRDLCPICDSVEANSGYHLDSDVISAIASEHVPGVDDKRDGWVSCIMMRQNRNRMLLASGQFWPGTSRHSIGMISRRAHFIARWMVPVWWILSLSRLFEPIYPDLFVIRILWEHFFNFR